MPKYRVRGAKGETETIDAIRVADAIQAAKNDWPSVPAWLREAYDRGEVMFTTAGISMCTSRNTCLIAEHDEWLGLVPDRGIIAFFADAFENHYEIVVESDFKNEDADPMPVFTIKAKDEFAYAAVEYYMTLCREMALHEQAEEVLKALREIQNWRERNPDKVKLPDHKHVPVKAPSSKDNLS